jgi:hypothetical protein
MYFAMPQSGQGFIGGLQRELLDVCAKGHARRQGQEFVTIVPGEISHGADAAFLPEQLLRK